MKNSYPATRNKATLGLASGNGILRILAEKSSDLIARVRLAPRFKVIYVSPSILRITGYTQKECLENPEAIIEGIQPEDVAYLKHIQDPDSPDGLEPVVLHGTRKDGSKVWVELTRTVVRNRSGNVDAYFICRDITRRTLAQDALRESQRFVSSLMENAPHATVVINPDTSIRYVNPVWEDTNGWTLDEVIGIKAPYPWWPKEQLESFEEDFKKALEQGDGKGEVLCVKKNGERYWISMNWTSVRSHGKIQYLIINSVDITERRRTEEQLRQLSSVTEQISEATIVTDPDFRITYLNHAAQDLFGYSPEEALGKKLSLFSERPLPSRKKRRILGTIAEGRVWSGVLTKRHKDGSVLLCDCRLSPLCDEAGRIISYIDVERDVTEQKEMERKLQEHKRLVESIISSLPEGVLVTDLQDRVVLANDAFHRIFRIPRKALEDSTFQELLRIEDLYKVYSSVRRGGAACNTLEFRYHTRRREKIIFCNVVNMDAKRMLLIFADISQEREDKEKLYLTDRLASIGEMAAGLAHELNNPLTAILTLSQLLLHQGLPGEAQEDMKCIYEEAQRATRIVKNVLLFTRNHNYEHGQSSVNDVVRDVLRLRQYDEQSSHISVVTNLAGDLPDVTIDRFQLQQVFLNIILNAEAAIKDTGRAGVLTVTTESAGGGVKIHFTDNGCGIKKNVIPRIFDPFFTTKDIGKGTGLGLSICYGIVVKHGGGISVRSRAGQGTTFTIEMPGVTS